MDELYSKLVEYPTIPLHTGRGFPEDEINGQLRKLLKLLNATPGSKLLGNLTGGLALFDALALPTNTLPYLFTLLAQVQAQGSILPDSPLWLRAQDFVLSFDPVQVRYAGFEFRRLLESIVDGAEAARSLPAAIPLLQQALLRLDPTTSTFTSLHLLFVRLCLLSRSYSEALLILDNDVYHISQSSSSTAERQNRVLCSPKNPGPTFITQEAGFSNPVEYQDHLLYYLYGGMLYIGANKWKRALTFFETVMICPTSNTASMIQVEAYKKWALVCLLEHGKIPSMPRGVNPSAAKHYRALGRPYETLGEAFKNPDSQKLRAEGKAGETIWDQDCNTGLVLQVVAAHQRFAVHSLSKIYTSAPLSAVHALAFPPTSTLEEVYTYITELIATGQLNATLHAPSNDPSDAILRFNASVPQTSPANGAPDVALDKTPGLLRQRARIEALSERMRDTRHRLEITRSYTDALARARRAEAEGKNTVAGAIGNGADWMSRDEELEMA